MWLHTPPTSRCSNRKLYHPWSGPFKVVKQISNSTYRIQQLNSRKQRKVHFNRLKPCPPNIRLETCQQETESTATHHDPAQSNAETSN